jgi:hypothetical protein
MNGSLYLQEIAFVTFKYPPVMIDDSGDCVSHYILLIADPVLKTVKYIDSRGKKYARRMNNMWSRCLDKLIDIFEGCKWQTIVQQDIQSNRLNDNFCQTWSLIIGINLSRNGKLSYHTMMQYKSNGFEYIFHFWKQIIRIPEIREGIYYEIYRRTHNANGTRNYDRYFSTLEYLVTTVSDVYYPHNVSYDKTGFTFIEEFVDCLNSENFGNILK